MLAQVEQVPYWRKEIERDGVQEKNGGQRDTHRFGPRADRRADRRDCAAAANACACGDEK
jgi:hypothetical protein